MHKKLSLVEGLKQINDLYIEKECYMPLYLWLNWFYGFRNQFIKEDGWISKWNAYTRMDKTLEIKISIRLNLIVYYMKFFLFKTIYI